MATTFEWMSGAYSVTYAGTDIGRTEVGFELVARPSYNPIRADATARNLLDGLFTGVEDIVVRIEAIEWSLALWAKMVPWLHDGSTGYGKTRLAGTLISSLSSTLILTPLTGPAVQSNAGKIWTFSKAYPLEPVRIPFSSQRLRTTTLGFVIFAQDVTSHVVEYFTLSS